MLAIDLFQPGKLNKTIEFPTEWNELSLQEMKLLGVALRDNTSRAQLFIDLLQHRGQLRRRVLRKLNIHDCTVDGLPVVDLLLKSSPRTFNPLPWLGRYKGPADAFNDLTVGEFEDTEIFFLQYNETNEVTHLRQLAAALWRETVHTPGFLPRRMRYYSECVMDKSFKHLDEASLMAIYLWYSGCRQHLADIFQDVFGGSGDGEEGESADLAAFTKLIHYGAGPKNGTRDQLRQALVKEFLFECQLQIIAARELEEKMEAGK